MSGYHVLAFAAAVAVGVGVAIYSYIKSKPVLVRENQYQGQWQCDDYDDYDNDTQEEDVEELKRRSRCAVCMNRKIGVLFSPCNHLVTCTECGPKIDVCPVCRRKVKRRIVAYLP